MATPFELFDWQVRYLDIYLFYVFASRGWGANRLPGRSEAADESSNNPAVSESDGQLGFHLVLVSLALALPHHTA